MERSIIHWKDQNGNPRWQYKDAVKHCWGWYFHPDGEAWEELNWLQDGSFVLEKCRGLYAVPDPTGYEEPDYYYDLSRNEVTEREAVAWLLEHGKHPPLEEWPADFYAVAAKYQDSATESSPSRPAEGESQQAPPEAASSGAPSLKASGQKPNRKEKWTLEEVNEAVRTYFTQTKAQEHEDFSKRLKVLGPDDAALRKAIRKVFGRNRVSRELGIPPSTLSGSVWRELAKPLGLLGLPRKPRRRDPRPGPSDAEETEDAATKAKAAILAEVSAGDRSEASALELIELINEQRDDAQRGTKRRTKRGTDVILLPKDPFAKGGCERVGFDIAEEKAVVGRMNGTVSPVLDEVFRNESRALVRDGLPPAVAESVLAKLDSGEWTDDQARDCVAEYRMC